MVLKKLVTDFLVLLTHAVTTACSVFLPARTDQIIICLQNGKFYSGNTRSFIDHCSETNDLPLRLIILCRGIEITSRVSKDYPSLHVVNSYSLKGWTAFVRTKVILISHGSFDYFPLTRLNHQKIINLWHGIPIKMIGLESSSTQTGFQYMVVSSPFEADLMKKAFSLRDNQLLILGMPRMDTLFKPRETQPSKKLKTILYVPTFRDRKHVRYFPFEDVNLDKLNSFCSKNGTQIIIKPHINDYACIETLNFNNYECITVETNLNADLQLLLQECWIVLTDYSGVYFDAVAIDKPIIFQPYDYPEYTAERGFLYDYYQNTPGPKIDSQMGLIQQIGLLLSGQDVYKNDRSVIRDKFFTYQDDRASERLLDFISELEN